MRLCTSIILALSHSLLAGEVLPDILRLSNGDQLHGTFAGIQTQSRLLWQRDDLAQKAEFQLDEIRHVSFQSGAKEASLPISSSVVLINGDRILGKILGFDGENLSLESPIAGTLQIPRKMLAIISPNPLGGRMYYHGSFSKEGWEVIDLTGRQIETEKSTADAQVKKPLDKWIFSGSSWYWPQGNGSEALVRKNVMPDRAVFQFDVAWKNRLSMAIGFHADFYQPAQPPDMIEEPNPEEGGFIPGDSSVLPKIFGNGYVLQFFMNNLMLYKTTIKADGLPSIERVQLPPLNLRLPESGRAVFEIRSNRVSGQVTLFVDGQFVFVWEDILPHAALVSANAKTGFGFFAQGDRSAIRIRDVILTEWNGMPDSARSMELQTQDVALMSNGIDRFGGQLKSIEQDQAVFTSRYGDFNFQLDDLAEIRFAADTRGEVPSDLSNMLKVRFMPNGVISGVPTSGTAQVLGLDHALLGSISVSLNSAVLLEFDPSTLISDDWDAPF
ncbi:MAG: hypothetical protein EAZ42_10190 [Verrucomicrobia bacterium]|nr:MAG: hypothetical protein EAZ42_10190 [Verrucomicrobiota bacterium]